MFLPTLTENKSATLEFYSEDDMDNVYKFLLHSLWLHLPPILLMNILVISAIVLVKELHNSHNVIICGLAVSDLFTGFITIPGTWIKSSEHHGSLESTRLLCYVGFFTYSIFPKVSVWFMVYMSVDRFFSIKF